MSNPSAAIASMDAPGKHNWLETLRLPPMPLVVLVFYGLNLDTIAGTQRYNPLWYQILLLGCVLGVALMRRAARECRFSLPRLRAHPLMAWGVVSLIIALVSAPMANDPVLAREGLRYAISTTVIVCTAAVAFADVPDRLGQAVGRVALVILIVASVSLVLDPIFDFRSWPSFKWITEYERTRAGGLYFQPNIAGYGIAALLGIVLPRVRPFIGSIVTALAAVAVLLTFSRGGLALLVFVVTLATIRGYLSRRAVLVLVVGLGLAIAGSDVSGETLSVLGINEGSGFVRLVAAPEYLSPEAISGDVRIELAKRAWHDAWKAPLLGEGVGYSWGWARHQSGEQGPHNMYLRHMLEFGILGGLLWPAFLLAIWRVRERKADRVWIAGCVAIGAMTALTSHNLTEQGAFLVPLIGATTLPVPRYNKVASSKTPKPQMVS